MAAVLTSELESADQIAFLINACREMGIKVLPPDVNSSEISFSVDSGCIRFGLGAIKGVGEVAASKIITSRETDGKFESFLDFCERCGTDVNSRMLEHLTRAGALDTLGLRRSQILAVAEPMMNFAASRAKDKAAGQGSLFDLLGDDDGGDEVCSVPIPDIPEFDREEILRSEKELLGFYVTGHPLDPYAELVKTYSSCPIRRIETLSDNSQIRIAGMVGSFTSKFSKKSGKPFGVMLLEDLDSSVECMLYERALSDLAQQEVTLEPGLPVLATVTVSKRDEAEKPRVIVEKVMPLAEAPNELTEELHIHLYADKLEPGVLGKVSEACFRVPGKVLVVLCLVGKDDSVTFIEARRDRITVTKPLLDELDRLLTPGHWRLKAVPYTPPPRRAWNRDREKEAAPAR